MFEDIFKKNQLHIIRFDIGPEDFSRVNVGSSLGLCLTSFILVPILMQCFRFHETLVLASVNVVTGATSALAAHVNTLFPGFLVPFFLLSVRGGNFAMGRALQTKGES
jgi:hypothetical protein